MQLGICGIGAIGSLLCARLRQKHNGIHAIIKASQVQSVLCHRSHEGAPAFASIKMTDKNLVTKVSVPALYDPNSIGTLLDIVLIAVKSSATKSVAQQLAKSKWIHPKTIFITLQNGLGNAQELESVLDNVYQGITFMGGNSVAPGEVIVGGSGKTILAGKLNDTEVASRFQTLQSMFITSGLECDLVTNEEMKTIVWKKLIINAAINTVASLLNGPNITTCQNSYSRAAVDAIVAEGIAVAAATGIQLDDFTAQNVYDVATSTRDNVCSMLSDLRANKPTEIAVINEAIVRAGDAAKIPTPVNSFVTNLIRSREKL